MAAPTPEELQRNFERLQRLATQLGKDFSSLNLRAVSDDAETVRELLSSWQRELNDAREGAESISASFKDVVQQISKSNVGLKTARSSFNKLSSLAEEIANHQAGYNKLSKDELKSISEKIAKEKRSLELNLSTLKIRKSELDLARRRNQITPEQLKDLDRVNEAIAESTSLVDNTNTAYQDLIANIIDIGYQQELVNEKMGITGTLVEGIGEGFKALGLGSMSDKMGLDDAKKKMQEIASVQAKQQQLTDEIGNLNYRNLSAEQIRAGFGGKELKEKQKMLDLTNDEADAIGANNGKLSVLTGGLKSMFSSLSTNLLDPAFLIAEFGKALTIVDDGAGDMAKKMNLTYDSALEVRRELGNMASFSNDVALNTKGLQETYMAIGQSLGSNAMMNEKDLITATKLREQAGYTNDQLIELNKLSAVNGKSIEKNTKEILGGAKAYAARRGLVINEKQVLEDVTKASSSLKLTLGGSADELARSAVQARAVGLNLEQASKISEGLLNFESSIESELSAELLTGKNLNLEKARSLALNGDIAAAAEEIANQVGSSEDFTKMNVLQQEALAKAAGLTRDELAQSLIDREALSKLSAKEGESSQQAFNRLVQEVGLEEAKKQLGDEQLANQFQQQSVQERLAQAVDKVKEVFIQLAEPVMAFVSPLADLLGSVLPGILSLLNIIIVPIQLISSLVQGIGDFFTWIGKGIGNLLPSLGVFGSILKGLASIAVVIAAYTAYASLAAVPFVGPVLGGIAAAAVLAAGFGLLSGIKTNDGYFPSEGESGYGKRTLLTPEGTFSLNNKDTVIAGTDLFQKGDDVMSAPKGAISVNNSTAPKPAPVDSNMLLANQMKRSNDLKEQEMRRDRTVSTLRIQ